MNKFNCNGCFINGMTQCDLGFSVEVKWGGEGEIMIPKSCRKKLTKEEYLKEINERYENKIKKDKENDIIN